MPFGIAEAFAPHNRAPFSTVVEEARHREKAAMIEIQGFDVHTASASEWARFQRYRRIRDEELHPGEPQANDADFEHAARRRMPFHDAWRFVALDDGELAGNLMVWARRPGTPGSEDFAPHLDVWLGVLAAYRRRGIASRMLRSLLSFMRERGKTLATMNTHLAEGHAFLAATGAVLKHRVVENRMRIDNLEWDTLARWKAQATEGAARSGLRWEIHAGRTPMARLASLMAPFSALFNDIPLGALELPPARYELEGYADWYAELDRSGGEHFLVLLVDGNDELVAMCEAQWDPRFSDRLHQRLTAVARAWRGQSLAKGVKAAMLECVCMRHPELRTVVTYNAEVNAPILAINRQLGFAVHRQQGCYQLGVEALAACVARRDGGR
ncbi:GNAT family N-acetyltransferase [Variovorax paradoxus]|uniref:GNAT family N-acetyltransferase n=1 Tax=Variovorax paradoxus TaxID=34073 RepID=UPI00278691C6|nr:GNAT family N-acetyltransferase [Variovorax paradoxus]MDQ0590161.1 GNAT superfamily N-acetyltransferase [Variovorax paradoxus]